MDIADRAKLYAGPLVTLDERGYTRHYFIEGRRVAGSIGGRGEFTMDTDKYLYPINDNMERNFESHLSHYISYWEGESLSGLPLQSATDGEAHIVFIYHSDHLGSGTAISSEGAVIHHTLSYLPFGETLMDIKDPYHTPYDLSTSYQFTGHEKDEETGLTYAHARYYDSELAIWLSVDPLAEKYPWISSYAYCNNNPVNGINPDGKSPYFTQDGKFLGVNENGFSGKIYITTKENFNKSSTNGIVNSGIILNTIDIKSANLSNAAEANIYTYVLSQSADIDITRLYNNSVSIYNGKSIKNIPQGYNDPNRVGRYNSLTMTEGEIKISVKEGAYKNELNTVESIINYLGIHEYNGHGINGYSSGKDHYKAYLDQYNHSTFKSLTIDQQYEIINRTINYMYTEAPNEFNYHRNNKTKLYRQYEKINK